MACYFIDALGPLTQYLKTFRNSAVVQNYSQYEPVAHWAFPKHGVSVFVALMQMRRREAGQGGGWGCGLEQLAATVPCVVYSGWMYRNGEARTAFGRVRLQTILWISNDCVGFSDVSGFSTSTSIWSRLNCILLPLPAAGRWGFVVVVPRGSGRQAAGLNDCWDNPNFSLVMEIPDTSKNQRVMRHNTLVQTAERLSN